MIGDARVSRSRKLGGVCACFVRGRRSFRFRGHRRRSCAEALNPELEVPRAGRELAASGSKDGHHLTIGYDVKAHNLSSQTLPAWIPGLARKEGGAFRDVRRLCHPDCPRFAVR
jgi:hypothetical protein